MVFHISPSDLDQEMQRGIFNLKCLVFQAFNQVKGNLLFHLCKTQISQHLAHPRYKLVRGVPAFKCLGSRLPVMIFVFLLFFFLKFHCSLVTIPYTSNGMQHVGHGTSQQRQLIWWLCSLSRGPDVGTHSSHHFSHSSLSCTLHDNH